MVVDEHILFVFGAGDGLFLPFEDGAVPRVLHILLSLSQQQLTRRGVQVLLTAILQYNNNSDS